MCSRCAFLTTHVLSQPRSQYSRFAGADAAYPEVMLWLGCKKVTNRYNYSDFFMNLLAICGEEEYNNQNN